MTAPLVLVVEDDDQTAFFLRHVLERDGFQVKLALNGEEVKEAIAEGPVPALVTLDIDLPDATGDELMLLIKTSPGWGKVPVVMVTATPRTDATTWAIKKGAKGYLEKPFKPQELIDCVRRLLGFSS